jgi:hypothetical protein
MNRGIFALAFLLGAMAVGWVGVGFVGSNALALVMTAIIAAVYLFGALEIREFRRATSTLAAALAAIPDRCRTWSIGSTACIRRYRTPCVCA